MIAIENCVREAVEKGGYIDFAENYGDAHRFLDIDFWQCLGKALGWDDYQSDGFLKDTLQFANGTIFGWRAVWHRFIDHLAAGRDAESFFANLV